jgi:type VI secretion system secreted protein VgrG
VLAGAVQAGQSAKGTGLTMIAGKGPVQMQAQADQAEVAAKNLVNVQSANAHIDWAAAKKVTLTTSGGAQIVIQESGITVQCPGQIIVRATTKSFIDCGQENYTLPRLPHVPIEDVRVAFNFVLTDIPGPTGVPLPHVDWRIVRGKNEDAALASTTTLLKGRSNGSGKVELTSDQERLLQGEWNRSPGQIWIVAESHAHELVLTKDRGSWSNDQKVYYALDAMGYSDDYGTTGSDSANVFHTRLARRDTNQKDGDSMLQSIKEE